MTVRLPVPQLATSVSDQAIRAEGIPLSLPPEVSGILLFHVAGTSKEQSRGWGEPPEGDSSACCIRDAAVSAGDTNITVPISAELIKKEQGQERALGKVIGLLREALEDLSWSRAAELS